MKKRILKIKNMAGLLLVSTLFIGCFSDTIQPDILQEYQRKIAVRALWTDGEVVSLELTNSVAAIDSNVPKLVKDAIVQYKSTADSGRFTYNQVSERYETAKAFSAGTAINVTIKHNGSPKLPSCAVLVKMPDLISATGNLVVNGALDTAGMPADKLTVTFNDAGNTRNFYKISLEYFNQTLSRWVPLILPKSDPSLAAYNSFTLNDASVLFSDELFNGSSKTITMAVPGSFVVANTGDKYRITLSSISEDFYSYYKSLQLAQDAKAINFRGGYNNAVVIHTNINGGVGILGTQTKNYVILK